MNTREGCLPSPSPCKPALHRQYSLALGSSLNSVRTHPGHSQLLGCLTVAHAREMLLPLWLLLNDFGASYRVCEVAIRGCENAAGPGSAPDFLLAESSEASNVKCSNFAACSSDEALPSGQYDW